MHIIDALISPAVGGVLWAASAAAVLYSIFKIKNSPLWKKRPIIAAAGAFVLAAQMIYFTIPAAGSSGHITGGILLAALLGSGGALLTMAAVLLVRTLIAADGGFITYGCNLFNMGVIPCILVYQILFKPMVKKFKPASIAASVFISVIISQQLGAFAVVVETFASGISILSFGRLLLFMQPVHLAAGIVEAIITSILLVFIHKIRPEILETSVFEGRIKRGVSMKKAALVLGTAVLIMGALLFVFRLAFPDGLQWSMFQIAGGGDELQAGGAFYNGGTEEEGGTAAPNLSVEVKEAPVIGNTLKGIIAVLIVFAIAGLLGFIMSTLKKKKGGTDKSVM